MDENVSIEFERDMIDVTAISEPDPDWHQECSCGIHHEYNKDKYSEIIHPSLPTLVWIVDVEGGEDYPDQGHYECKECGEEIIPKSRPGRKRSLPVRCTVKINGEIVTKDEFINYFTKQGYDKSKIEEIWPS